MKHRVYRASDGTVVTVRWTAVKGPAPGVRAPEVEVAGQALPLESVLPDGRRLTVRWPGYGEPDVILAGAMLEGSASHPATAIARGRGALFFGAVLLAMFAMGTRAAAGLVVQLGFAAGFGIAAAIAKPLPRAALAVSALSMVSAAGAWLTLHDKRVVLVLPMLVLWFGAVWPMARAARARG
jgi:hypothetical protein